MASREKIHEGVFAIHKPQGITSAAVIRSVQSHFNPSQIFAPWFEREQSKLDVESHNQRQKRRARNRVVRDVKMGHGGTLDPLATGVLILGVGSGTKRLGGFLGCTKEYECVVLFGAATDTYDVEGRVVGRKGFEGVGRERVEEVLGRFRGEIMQVPPIYSALKVQGKKLMDYAREGKEVPVEIKARPVTVSKLEMVEWMDGGTHGYHWPTKEADQEEKEVVDKVQKNVEESTGPPAKRRKTETAEGDEAPSKPAVRSPKPSYTPTNAGDEVDRESCPAPACRIRMQVSSGFYVRSLCDDLGKAVGSLALMSSLVRSRQGDFALGTDQVLPYEDLDKGEEVWGPKVKQMLENWQSKDEASRKEDRDNDHDSGQYQQPKQRPEKRRRRNSSSSESD